MNVILTDIEGRENMLPLSFTKHCAHLRVGINTIFEKWQLALGKQPQLFTAQYLQVNSKLKLEDSNILVNALVLPNSDLVKALSYLDQGATLTTGDTFIAAKISGEEMAAYMDKGSLPNDNVEFRGQVSVIKYPWHLFERDSALISAPPY